MTHIALYRKYRPQTFNDVIGQDHIVDSLKQSIKSKSIAHAYLFAGSKGIGKTSIARIFAREIDVKDVDLYELDAASNRGIDDVRAMREAVQTVPVSSPYKVYIIDEAHMLTKEAFNALLKTLEEPPAHIIFILATTEMEKLPDTIISRCQVYKFRKPGKKILQKAVIDVAKKEGVDISPEIAHLIASAGGGAFRDTLGVLEKVLVSVGKKKITSENVKEILGETATSFVYEYLESFFSHDVAKGIKAISLAKESGFQMNIFGGMVLSRLRAVLFLRFSPASKSEIEEEYGEEFENLSKIAEDKKNILNSEKMIKAIEAISMIKNSPIPELPLELLLLDESDKK